MHVVIVSPAFPPFSGVGGLRMSSLASYLSQQGVKVTVVRNAPLTWGESNLQATVPAGIGLYDVAVEKEFNTNALLYYAKLQEILEQELVDVIVYSVGPFYTVKTSVLIKQQFNVPYIIDFRDLWTFEQRTITNWILWIKVTLMRFKHWLIEYPAVKQAAAVVTVTAEDQRVMTKYYPSKRGKIHTIYNGFDGGLKYADRAAKADLQLVVLGKLAYYAPHLAKLLFESIEAMDDQTIRIHHVGQPEAFLTKLEMEKGYTFYQCYGYQPYQNGIEIAMTADVGIIIYNHPTGLGTKIFDYVACNIPIILICDKVPVLEKFVKQFKHGFVCHTKTDIIDTLRYIKTNNIKTLDEQSVALQYSREQQNMKYLALMNELGSSEKK